MTKEITIRIEFNDKDTRVIFDTLFKAKYLRRVRLGEPIVDYAIIPIDTKEFFTDEEVEAFLSEFDEKVKSYEIIEIKEI